MSPEPSLSKHFQMLQPLQIFADRLYSEWLPEFCDARDADFDEAGFVGTSLRRLSVFDAEWFLRAVDIGFLSQENGYFFTERSKAKEQIFWSGPKKKKPRSLTLWLEPIITMGACARLIEKYGWPSECVGMQSPYPWAFDLMCYNMEGERAIIAGEVKKSANEAATLIEKMKRFLADSPLDPNELKGADKNAFKKVDGLYLLQPDFLWIVGPDRNEQLYKVTESAGIKMLEHLPENIPTLDYSPSY